jgi:hypothetical protein
MSRRAGEAVALRGDELGGTGIVTGSAESAAIQADDKVVVASGWSVARLNNDGSLDSSFGSGGTSSSGLRGPDVNGGLGSQGHNLIGNPQDMTGWVSTDLLHVNPMLGPLQDNGGPTQTMALLRGSPAIDAGDNTDAPMWDQRGPGFPRIEHGIIDIGAFEYHFPRQPVLDPVPVQALPSVNSPLFVVTPAPPAELPPLSVPGVANGQARQQASLAPATTPVDLPIPRIFCHTFAGTGQPAAPVGQSDAGDLDLALSQQWRI